MTKFNPSHDKKIDNNVLFSIRTKRELLETLDKLSSKRNMSRNEFVVKCIKYALENLADKD